MSRFFFDIRSGDTVRPDTNGVELAGIEAAVEEATMALADAVEDAWAGDMPSELSVEVVDERREPQFCATIRFEPGALPRQETDDRE